MLSYFCDQTLFTHILFLSIHQSMISISLLAFICSFTIFHIFENDWIITTIALYVSLLDYRWCASIKIHTKNNVLINVWISAKYLLNLLIFQFYYMLKQNNPSLIICFDDKNVLQFICLISGHAWFDNSLWCSLVIFLEFHASAIWANVFYLLA
jgi:hypothetical protein